MSIHSESPAPARTRRSTELWALARADYLAAGAGVHCGQVVEGVLGGEGAKAYVIFREPIVERLDGQVRLYSEVITGGMRFSAHNELFAPVEVELRLERLGNVHDLAPRIVRRVVPARSTLLLTALTARQVGKPVRMQWGEIHLTLAATPAPDCTRRVCPWALSFLTVSGVTATRVSPTVVSMGMPMSIRVSYMLTGAVFW